MIIFSETNSDIASKLDLIRDESDNTYILSITEYDLQFVGGETVHNFELSQDQIVRLANILNAEKAN